MTTTRRSTRLSKTDWIDTALSILIAEGVGGLKIARLCDELHVTKGSFYWHFKDIDALWEAMAERWRETNSLTITTELRDLVSLPASDRLVALATMLMSEKNLTVETAIRDWARTNDKVAQTVRRIDAEALNVVYETLRELHVTEEQSRLMAGLLVYAGIGYIHGHEGLPSPTADELNTAIGSLLAAVVRRD